MRVAELLEGPVKMTDNGMVYARLFDSSGH